jgi:hypothetical protein
MIPALIIDIISKVSPILGTALGGPIGSVVGSLISTALGGVDMSNTEQVAKVLQDPANIQKLKELELQLNDLQNARLSAEKEKGAQKLIRPLLALAAMVAIFIDVYFIDYVNDSVVRQIMIMMLIFLVWDIRQIYKFYFGNYDDVPTIPFMMPKKK